MRLRAQVHREDPLPQVVVALPAAGDLRGQRGGRPGVHHVRVADEAAGLAALVLGVAVGRPRGRVERQLLLAGEQRVGVVGLTVTVEGVPDGERDAEEPLARDQPVAVEPAHPVVVAVLHVGREELHLGAAIEHVGADGRVAATVADVPLPGGDDLERLVALLVEVRLPLRGGGLAVEVAGLAQLRDDRLPRGERGLALEVLVRRGGLLAREPLRGLAGHPAVAADDRAHRQLQLAPPGDVGQVAERAGHRDAGALVHLREVVGEDRDLDAEDRRGDRGPEQRLVALVVRVGDQRDHAGDQLGARGLDVHRLAVGTVEGHPVVVAGVVPGLELGLGDGGLEGDVPQGRRLLQVGLAAGEVAQEGLLADQLGLRADRRVVLAPVHGEAQRAPQLLEDLLVLLDEALAELDEVRPADRDLPLGVRLLGRRELGVVGQARVAADAEVVLDAALGREAVVVPAHRVEDRLPAHPLVARDQVGVGVGEHVADVEAAADGRRRRVDRVHVGAGPGAVEAVGVVGLPLPAPGGLETLEGRLLRYDDGTLVGARRRRGLVVRGLGHVRNPRARWGPPGNRLLLWGPAPLACRHDRHRLHRRLHGRSRRLPGRRGAAPGPRPGPHHRGVERDPPGPRGRRAREAGPGAPAVVGRRAGRLRRGRGDRHADGAVRAVPALRPADAGRGGAGARPGAARPRRGGARRERRAARRPDRRRRDRPARRGHGLGARAHPAVRARGPRGAGAGPGAAAAGGRVGRPAGAALVPGLRGGRRGAGRSCGRRGDPPAT